MNVPLADASGDKPRDYGGGEPRDYGGDKPRNYGGGEPRDYEALPLRATAALLGFSRISSIRPYSLAPWGSR